MSGDHEESGGFLSRWSRRKTAAAEERAPAPPAPEDIQQAEEPAFDVSTLPPIETLTPTSDITQFLQKGVPPGLKSAALKHAWVADAAIRDHIGLSEMSWDFNAPEAFPGYGALAPGADIAKMASDIATHGWERVTALVAPEPPLLPASLPQPQDDGDQDLAGALAQAEPAPPALLPPGPPARRRHGGATPR